MKKIVKLVALCSLVLIFGTLLSCQQTGQFFTVKFFDGDNNLIDTQRVKKGSSAQAPQDPIKEGYTFIGWSEDFSSVTKNLDLYPMFDEIKEFFDVFFLDEAENVLRREIVLKGNGATAPIPPEKRGYKFVGWDTDFSYVTENTYVRPLYEKENIDIELGDYVKYVESISHNDITDSNVLLASLDLTHSLYTFTNIFIGGFRNANQMHYYDAQSYQGRNAYGYEVGVASNGIVVSAGTLVDLPEGGFILSGHSSTATLLQSKVQIGDYVVFHRDSLTVKGHRDTVLSKLIGLNVKINETILKTQNAYYSEFRALNYEKILEKINSAIDTYNDLVANPNEYSASIAKEVENTLLLVDFLLVETNPIETKAFWHYPLRSGDYEERNLSEVEELLDDVKALGFNKVYLNVTFGGHAIYPSDYLPQRHSDGKVYTGYKDYLECFVEEAHKRGIEVSAWTNTLICGDGWLPAVYKDRGWVLTGFNGEDNFNGMYFLDISRSDVQEFLINVFTELVANYNLDGVEFDFIRFPGGNLYSYDGVIANPAGIKDGGYTDSFINLFKTTTGFSGDVKQSLIQSKTFRNQWLQFKGDLLNGLVENLVTEMRKIKPNISFSGAIMPSISSAINVYQQNWDLWLDNGWLDTLEPMIYSGDTGSVMSTLASFYQKVNGRADIFVGLFPEGNGGLPGLNAEQIYSVISAYPVGWCKFSAKTIFSNRGLMDGFSVMKRDYTVSMTSSKQDKLLAYILQLRENVKEFYQYVDTGTDYSAMIAYLESITEITEETYITGVLEQILLYIDQINHLGIKEKLYDKHQIIAALMK
jgi:uncharacterized lipoprotein YddW (UPF0748 family)